MIILIFLVRILRSRDPTYVDPRSSFSHISIMVARAHVNNITRCILAVLFVKLLKFNFKKGIFLYNLGFEKRIVIVFETYFEQRAFRALKMYTVL